MFFTDAVRDNHSTAKESDINTRIAAWFRGSEDRGGGRKKRDGNPKKNHQKAGSQNGRLGTEEHSDEEPLSNHAANRDTSFDGSN